MGLVRSIFLSLLGFDDPDGDSSGGLFDNDGDVEDLDDFDNDSEEIENGESSSAMEDDVEGTEGFSSDHDNLTFGKTPEGFIDQHKTVDVKIMGNDNKGKLHILKKTGSSSIWVSDGNCRPVCLNGHVWVEVGSHRYMVSDILKKV